LLIEIKTVCIVLRVASPSVVVKLSLCSAYELKGSEVIRRVIPILYSGNAHCTTPLNLHCILSKFFHQLMHNWIVLKTILNLH